MRASRQKELRRVFSLHVVCSWLGNSPPIAQRSYRLVTKGILQERQNKGEGSVQGSIIVNALVHALTHRN